MSPTLTIKFGDTWQYEKEKFSLSIMIVQPFAPLNPVNETTPEEAEKIVVPSGAAMSIPEWFVDAPVVGDFLGPKEQVMVWKPGTGHIKSEEK